MEYHRDWCLGPDYSLSIPMIWLRTPKETFPSLSRTKNKEERNEPSKKLHGDVVKGPVDLSPTNISYIFQNCEIMMGMVNYFSSFRCLLALHSVLNRRNIQYVQYFALIGEEPQMVTVTSCLILFVWVCSCKSR